MNEVVKINVAMNIDTVNEYRAIIGGECYKHQEVIDSINNLLHYAKGSNVCSLEIPVKKLKKIKKVEEKELSYWDSLSEIFDNAYVDFYKKHYENNDTPIED